MREFGLADTSSIPVPAPRGGMPGLTAAWLLKEKEKDQVALSSLKTSTAAVASSSQAGPWYALWHVLSEKGPARTAAVRLLCFSAKIITLNRTSPNYLTFLLCVACPQGPKERVFLNTTALPPKQNKKQSEDLLYSCSLPQYSFLYFAL